MRIAVLLLAVGAFGCTGSSGPSAAPRIPVQLDDEERVTAAGSPMSIYPDLDRVPLNALDFRIGFPEPLALAPHQIRLLDAYGVEVPAAVRAVELDGELRSVRIQPEGLAASERYILVIEGLKWRDGGDLATRKHSFFVLDEDHRAPHGRDIRVRGNPEPGTRNEVRVVFPEPMASDSLDALTAVAGGAVAKGEWSLVEGGHVAQFLPTDAWPEGQGVTVSLAAGLRDLAGNALEERPRGMLVPMVPVGGG